MQNGLHSKSLLSSVHVSFHWKPQPWRCLNLLMLSLAAHSPSFWLRTLFWRIANTQEIQAWTINNRNGRRKLASAGNERMTGNLGKVSLSAFLHSLFEAPAPKNLTIFFLNTKFLKPHQPPRADDKQAAEYGFGRVPTGSSCL